MSSRYTNNQIQKLKDGRNVFRTKIYPNIPLSDSDIYAVTQTGDRLDTLAHQFFGDASLWWIIATANNIHDAPFAIADGTILRIPMKYIEVINNFTK
jgi:hypothetical protein